MSAEGAKRTLDAMVAAATAVAGDTYVFEQTEVRKTGRTAEHTLRSGKVDVVVEITPVDSIVGGWKKWVRADALFIVQQ